MKKLLELGYIYKIRKFGENSYSLSLESMDLRIEVFRNLENNGWICSLLWREGEDAPGTSQGIRLTSDCTYEWVSELTKVLKQQELVN